MRFRYHFVVYFLTYRYQFKGGSMGYWELANKIESISHRLESVKSIIELVAEGTQDNVYSSSLWGSTDILGVYIKQLEDLSQEVLDMHKEQKIVAAKATKGKK